jgi:TRAP-type mannitol/chloroaromatic compound transport system substrate-binding protein
MDKMDEKHGIKSSIIHGYETLSSNTNDEQLISEHPGFKRIVQQLNSNRDELRIWLQEGEVTTNKKGVLWNHLEIRDPALMTRGQLMEKATQLQIMNEKYDTLQKSQDALQAAHTATERELIKERTQCNTFFRQLCEKIEECGRLKMENDSLRRRLPAE